MSETNKIQLIPLVDKRYGSVSIANLDKAREEVEKVIKDNSTFLDPRDEAEMKLCKKERTELNNKTKELARARLDIVGYLTGDFVEQCKSLEKLLKEASDNHTKAINAVFPPKPPKPKLELACPDEETKQKVLGYALSLGCELKERKKGEEIDG